MGPRSKRVSGAVCAWTCCHETNNNLTENRVSFVSSIEINLDQVWKVIHGQKERRVEGLCCLHFCGSVCKILRDTFCHSNLGLKWELGTLSYVHSFQFICFTKMFHKISMYRFLSVSIAAKLFSLSLFSWSQLKDQIKVLDCWHEKSVIMNTSSNI